MERYLKYFGIVSVLLFTAGLVSSFVILLQLSDIEDSYKFIWLWPLCFSIFVIICLRSKGQIAECHLLGTALITLAIFTKCVVYPIYVLLSGHSYTGIRQVMLTSGDIQEGTLITAFELVVVSIFIRLYQIHSKKKESVTRREKHVELKMRGSKVVYAIYLLIAIAVYLVFGRSLNVVQFLVMSIAQEEGLIEVEPSIYDTLVKYIVSIGIAILTLLCFDRNKKIYVQSGRIKKRYIYFSILAAMLFTACIIGESRGTQIALGFVMCLILIIDYPQKYKSIVAGIGTVLIIVVMSITFIRTNGGGLFVDDSYAAKAEKYQVYYGGPESVAQNIKVLEPKHLGLSQLVFDFVRSTFPFNLFTKSLGNTTSQIYNLDIYSGNTTHGHIVFSSSYGYLFFGFLGIPLTMMLNVFLILLFSKYFYFARSYETKYLFGYCLMRLQGACLVNTPTILGSVTQYIFTFGLLYYVAFVLNKNKYHNSKKYVQLT